MLNGMKFQFFLIISKTRILLIPLVLLHHYLVSISQNISYCCILQIPVVFKYSICLPLVGKTGEII